MMSLSQMFMIMTQFKRDFCQNPRLEDQIMVSVCQIHVEACHSRVACCQIQMEVVKTLITCCQSFYSRANLSWRSAKSSWKSVNSSWRSVTWSWKRANWFFPVSIA